MEKFWHWVANGLWHWAIISAQAVAVLVGLYQAALLIIRWSRKAKDWWSLRSHRRTVRRLEELELELHKLDEKIVMEEKQILFYNWVVVMLSLLATGFMTSAFYMYAYFYALLVKQGQPATFAVMAFSCVLFAFAGFAGVWGMSHFSPLLPSQKRQKRAQVEQGIKAMQEKLSQKIISDLD